MPWGSLLKYLKFYLNPTQRTVSSSIALVLIKDLTYQDSCYWKVYLTPSEGHGIGWSKPSFWWIWCDSRGHLVLRSTSITKIYASSNPPCANLCFSFTFVRVNTADGLKSMAELNLGWFIRLLCLFLFAVLCQYSTKIMLEISIFFLLQVFEMYG